MMLLPVEIPQEIVDEITATRILMLITGTLKDGSAHYAYASIPLENYLDFKRAEAAGAYRLEDYGEVIAHGEGSEPSAEIRLQMERERGANHLFEEELTRMLDTLKQDSQ